MLRIKTSTLLLLLSLLCSTVLAGTDRTGNVGLPPAANPLSPTVPEIEAPTESSAQQTIKHEAKYARNTQTTHQKSKHTSRIERYIRHKMLPSIPVIGKKLAHRPKFTWWMGALAFVVLCIGCGALMTGLKGWEMTLTNVLTNSIRIFGIFIILFLIGLTVYGIVNGGRI